MTPKRRYRSDLAEAQHRSATALYRAGAMDAETMRVFDDECLVPEDRQQAQVKEEDR